MNRTPLRAIYDMTIPMDRTGDQITYLDTAEPGPVRRPAVQIGWGSTDPDWYMERIAAETARPRRRRRRRRSIAVRPVAPARPRAPRPRTIGAPECAVIAIVALALIGAYATLTILIDWLTR